MFRSDLFSQTVDKILVKEEERIKPLDRVTMLSQEWHDQRRQGLGGSDAATIMGCNPYKNSYSLWLEKTGQAEDESIQNAATEWGHRLEGVVAKKFADDTGFQVREPCSAFCLREYEYIRANVDRFVSTSSFGWFRDAILEVKTAAAHNARMWESGPPEHYLWQVAHYLAVFDVERAYVAVLIGGRDYRAYTIERDDEQILKLLETEIEWWNKHVINGEPPEVEIDYSSETPRPEAVTFDTTLCNTAFQYKDAKKQRDHYESLMKEYRAELENELKTASRAVDEKGKTIATWSGYKTKSFDTKALKRDKPDIYEQYQRENQFRRLRVY